MSQKVGKFSWPPPRCFGLFWIWEKFEIRPPPLGPNLGKLSNWENFEFWEPPLKTRNISLEHLKLPKNHFKTKLFIVQLKHLKSAFLQLGKKWKYGLPPPLIKKSTFWTFSTFWDIFYFDGSPKWYYIMSVDFLPFNKARIKACYTCSKCALW